MERTIACKRCGTTVVVTNPKDNRTRYCRPCAHALKVENEGPRQARLRAEKKSKQGTRQCSWPGCEVVLDLSVVNGHRTRCEAHREKRKRKLRPSPKVNAVIMQRKRETQKRTDAVRVEAALKRHKLKRVLNFSDIMHTDASTGRIARWIDDILNGDKGLTG